MKTAARHAKRAGRIGAFLTLTAMAVAGWASLACYSQPANDGSSGDADASVPGCPNDLPADCPASPPSYRADIAPLIEARCLPCHGPDHSPDTKYDFSTYDSVYAHRTDVLTQVYSCKMPLADAAAPTAIERQELLAWLVCHAPNN